MSPGSVRIVAIIIAILFVASAIAMVQPLGNDAPASGKLLWSIDRQEPDPDGNIITQIDIRNDGTTAIMDNHTLTLVERSGSILWSRNIGYFVNDSKYGMYEANFFYLFLKNGDMVINEVGSEPYQQILTCIGMDGTEKWRAPFTNVETFAEDREGNIWVSSYDRDLGPILTVLENNGKVMRSLTVKSGGLGPFSDGSGDIYVMADSEHFKWLDAEGNATIEVNLTDGRSEYWIKADGLGNKFIGGNYFNDSEFRYSYFLEAFDQEGRMIWEFDGHDDFSSEISNVYPLGDGGARVLMRNMIQGEILVTIDHSGNASPPLYISTVINGTMYFFLKDGFVMSNGAELTAYDLDLIPKCSVNGRAHYIGVNDGIIVFLMDDVIQAYTYVA